MPNARRRILFVHAVRIVLGQFSMARAAARARAATAIAVLTTPESAVRRP